MTPIQFLKKYVSKKDRLEADEALHNMLMDSHEDGFAEALSDFVDAMKGWTNELKNW